MALLRSKPRYLLDTEAYLFDETFNDPTGLLSDTPTAAAAPVAAAPAPAPAVAAGWTPWTGLEEKQIGDYYYLPQVQPGQANWEDPHASGPTLTGLTRIKASDRSAFMDPHRQQPFDPYTSNFIPYEAIDPATGQVIGGVTKPEYTTGWQPGQAWDPSSTKPALVGGDLYMPGFDESGQLTGLTRFIGGKPAPGQTGQAQSYDPRTGQAIQGLGIQSYTPYKVDPSGGNIFFEAFTGALPMLAPIGAYAMGLGATGAASVATDVAGAASSALDAGMGVYPSTGLVVPSALDAGLGVYSLPTQDLSAAVAASASDTLPGLLADNVLPGIAEGMVPGVTAPALGAAGAASAAGDAAGFIGEGVASGIPAWDAAAINAGAPLASATALTPAAMESLIGTPGYGVNAAAQEFARTAGMDMALVGSGASLPFEAMGGTTSSASTETTGLSSEDRAALRSNDGYGQGMTGTQTSVYDSVLNITGNKEVADLFSNAVGSGTSVLDWLKENPTAGQALFSAAGALLNTAGGGGSGGSGGYVDSGYRPTLTDRQPVSKQQSMPITPVSLILPTTGQANSGLWRYGLLGG